MGQLLYLSQISKSEYVCYRQCDGSEDDSKEYLDVQVEVYAVGVESYPNSSFKHPIFLFLQPLKVKITYYTLILSYVVECRKCGPHFQLWFF